MRRGQISPAPGERLERMPLVEVRPAHTELLGAGSCLGDPQVQDVYCSDVANWGSGERSLHSALIIEY